MEMHFPTVHFSLPFIERCFGTRLHRSRRTEKGSHLVPQIVGGEEHYKNRID